MRACLLSLAATLSTGCLTLPADLAWQPATQGLPAAVPVLAVAVDSRQPGVLLAATSTPPRLYRSQDGGASTQETGRELAGRLVHTLLALPSAPGVILAGTSDGLWRSADGGDTWQPVAPDLPQPVLLPEGLARHGRSVYHLLDGADGALYLAGEGNRLWRSDDGGLTWQASAPLPAGAAILAVALSPDGARLLAGADGAGLFRSDDGGNTWQAAQDIPETFVAGLWFDPSGNGVAYARTRLGLYRSENGGVSWQPAATDIEARIDTLLPGPAPGQALLLANDGRVYQTLDGGRQWLSHGDLGRSGAVYTVLRSGRSTDPAAAGGMGDMDPARLLAGTHFGLLASADGGRTWQPWGPGPGVSPVNDLAQSPDGVLFLASAAGLFRSEDSGATWQPAGQGLPTAPALSVAVAPSAARVLYAGFDGRGLYRSADGGRTWAATALDVPSVPGILIDPADPDHLWARAAFQRMYESRDGGATWVTPWSGFDLNTEIMALSLASGDPAALYAAGTTTLYRSLDGAGNWQPIGPELAGQTVFVVLADPENAQRLYAGATKGLYVSDDSGDSWQVQARGLEEITVAALAFHPQRRNVLFAGTKYHGLYRSLDSGRTWQPAGLAGASVNRLLVSSDGRWLFAAADTGVWRAAIGGAP